MKIVASFFGIISLLGMLLAFIPLLGWLNWLIIPFAIIGLILSSFSKSSAGRTLCIVAIIFGILRLILGGGIL